MLSSAPDLPTLRLCSFLASVAFALVFLVLWRGRRSELHLLHWGVSSVLYAVVLASFEALKGPPPTPTGAALFALLAASNALVLSGANVFDGRRPFQAWMAAPVVLTGLLFAGPLGFAEGDAQARAWSQTGAAIGLAVSVLSVGAALGLGRQNRPTVGRRIAGAAIAAFAPSYAVTILADLTLGTWLDRFAIVPLLSDQLLLPVLYLGLLAMPGERMQRTLRDHALLDPLTGVGNRRALDEALRTEPTAGSLGVVLVDVDRFKLINDRDGHAAGDAVLLWLAAHLASLAGPSGGRVFRLGGDEFLVLLPRVTLRRAHGFAEQALASAASASAGRPDFTVSVGVAVADSQEGDLSQALTRADAALYRAKAEGRNRAAA